MGQANINVYTTKLTTPNTDTQIFRSPWLITRRYILERMTLTNEGTACIVKFYDKDISSGVPPVSGDSVNAPLLEYNVGANSTLIIDELMCLKKPFVAGMVGNTNIANLIVMVQIRED